MPESEIIKMKLMTRGEVIDAWEKNGQFLNWYVCPNCRDILSMHQDGRHFKCMNSNCMNYDLEIEKIEE